MTRCHMGGGIATGAFQAFSVLHVFPVPIWSLDALTAPVHNTERSWGPIRTADNRRRRGRGFPPDPPPPLDRDFIVGKKMKFTKGNIDLGYFLSSNFWVPNPPPPPLF